MVISNNPWFVYDEDIFTPKELDNFKKVMQRPSMVIGYWLIYLKT